jgi:Fur family ferric uptake transcriptional regulator
MGMAQTKRARTLLCGRPAAPLPTASNEAKLSEWQSRLREFLTREGLKYTEQRWKIALLILSTGGHVDAQGIVDKVKQQHPDIGAATVYRNIKVLCDAKILKESLTDPQGRVVYELFDEEHHDHIVCLDCGEIFEFHDEKIEALQTEVVRGLKFSQVRHRHVIYANCGYKK